MMNSILTSKWTKVVLFLVCLIPAGMLIRDFFTGGLGGNPTQFLEHATGDWTLRFLAITLSVSPLRKIFRLPQLIRFRRMLGLFAFFYVCCHFTIYLCLDQVLDFHSVLKDVIKRPFITVGFTGFVLMIPLAITSTAGWIRRLGGRRWRMLHRAIYLSAVAGVVHYYWMVKSDVHLPLEYAGVISVLLGWRLFDWYTNHAPRTATAEAAHKETSSPAAE
ncbi:MAG TPA: protein-methionine-sulfoxide reductase heme-binding subunit MsrQ [Candidatus Dormibacteraeota bacterium]|nr:protein-methionine-sulfoxide reductase heme-binding subunit MsrQ [Candidatus Dormibacteraeota bacterium]